MIRKKQNTEIVWKCSQVHFLFFCTKVQNIGRRKNNRVQVEKDNNITIKYLVRKLPYRDTNLTLIKSIS